MSKPSWDSAERFGDLDERVAELAPFISELAIRNPGYHYVVIIVDPAGNIAGCGNQDQAERMSIVRQMGGHSENEISAQGVVISEKGN